MFKNMSNLICISRLSKSPWIFKMTLEIIWFSSILGSILFEIYLYMLLLTLNTLHNSLILCWVLRMRIAFNLCLSVEWRWQSPYLKFDFLLTWEFCFWSFFICLSVNKSPYLVLISKYWFIHLLMVLKEMK